MGGFHEGMLPLQPFLLPLSVACDCFFIHLRERKLRFHEIFNTIYFFFCIFSLDAKPTVPFIQENTKLLILDVVLYEGVCCSCEKC